MNNILITGTRQEWETGMIEIGSARFRFQWNNSGAAGTATFTMNLPRVLQENIPYYPYFFTAHGPCPRPSKAGLGRIKAAMRRMRWTFDSGISRNGVARTPVIFEQVLTGQPPSQQ